MNKNYLILGGSVAAALAGGATGGYFLAKKKFEKKLDELVTAEAVKAKEFYEREIEKARLTQVVTSDPAPAKIISEVTDDEEKLSDDEEKLSDDEEKLSDDEEKLSDDDRRIIDNANAALTDYRGISGKMIGDPKPPLSEVAGGVEHHNIFTDTNKPKKKLPPRDPTTGHFISKKDQTEENHKDDPYLITQDDFFLNDPEYDQENLLYFAKEKTLIQVYDNEVVDNAHVGEVNLTLFPDVPEGEASLICVRNDGLQRDYEIKLTHDSLTEYMGLGEEDPDDDEDEEDVEDDEDERIGDFAERPEHYV